jgi:hypothetical protein
MVDRRTAVVVVLLALVVGVPFLDKAFHIDDPFVLKVAEQIQKRPLQPYDFSINWHRNTLPVVEITKNPPLVSYYLAPFAALFGYSERVLHGAMMLFLVLLGAGCVVLGRRFGAGRWWPLLFVMLSPAVVVSGNVMRDVPAAALGTLGVALFVVGTDEERDGLLAWGAVLVSLAMLAKYSSAMLVGVMALYALLSGRWRKLGWLLIPLAVLHGWNVWNWLSLGRAHVGVLLAQRASAEMGFGRPILEKLFCGLTIPSAMLYLLPAALLALVLRRRWFAIALAVVVGIVALLGAQAYQGQAHVILRRTGQPPLKGHLVEETAETITVRTEDGEVTVPRSDIRERVPPEPSGQYYVWVVTSAVLLCLVLGAGLFGRMPPEADFSGGRLDGAFLALWVLAVFGFSVLVTPFQAVRHFLPALAPTAVLALRLVRPRRKLMKGILAASLLLQAGVAFLVGAADAEHAGAYPRFVRHAQETYADEEVWFNGHWGFHWYAQRAGFQGMNRDEPPFPPTGAIVLQPRPIPIAGWPKGLKRKLVERFTYEARVPARAIDGRHAYFYALVHQRCPYFFPGLSPGEPEVPLITCLVWRVTESPANDAEEASRE